MVSSKNKLSLSSLLTDKHLKTRPSGLLFPLGTDSAGKLSTYDFQKSGGLLVGGGSKSGKSNFLRNIVISLRTFYKPNEVGLIIVDHDRGPLSRLRRIPHLLFPMINSLEQEIQAVAWLKQEFNRRYHLLSDAGTRTIALYNQRCENPLPYLVYIADEPSEWLKLKGKSGHEIQDPLYEIGVMGRAVGMFCVVSLSPRCKDLQYKKSISGLILNKAQFPGLKRALRGIFDEEPDLHLRPGQFIFSGSSDLDFHRSEITSPRSS